MHQKTNGACADAEGGGAHSKPVHSGHFMISTLDGDGEDDDDIGVPLPSEGPAVMPLPVAAYDFEKASKTTSATYNFQGLPKIIDNSLAKLFRAMTLAYSGQLTSPKFKSFKGLKLNLKDKLRLNNIIWREWHMQYIKQMNPVICSFNAVIDDVHQKPEAVVLEGKYWKRRLEIVCSEYKKWRVFFKEKMRAKARVLEIPELLERVAEHDAFRLVSNQLFVDPPPQLSEEDFRMDFSDTLFSSLNQPFHFPNPREMGQLGNADFIQPGLIGLQPNLEDVNFMDTVDPLHEDRDLISKEFLMDSPFPDNVFSGITTSFASSQAAAAFKTSPELLFPSCAVSLANTMPYTPMLPAAATSSSQNMATIAGSSADGDCSYVFYTSPDDLLTGYVPGLSLAAGSGSATASSHSAAALIAASGVAVSTSAALTAAGSPAAASAAALSGEAAATRRSPRSPATRCKSEDVSVRAKLVSSKPRTIAPAPRTGGSIVVAASAGSPAAISASSAPSQPQQQQQVSAVAAANTFLAQLLTTGSVLVSPAAPPCPPPSSGKADLAIGGATLLAQYQPVKSVSAASTSASMMATVGSILSGTSGSATSSNTKQRPSRQPSQSSASPPSLAVTPTSPLVRQLSLTQSTSQLSADSPPFFHDDNSLPESSFSDTAKGGGRPSPGKSDSCVGGKDVRRASHISAEQKRRGHIKSGFDILHTLIPALSQNPNAKVSKAAMLQKTAEYCRKLKTDRAQVQEESDQLRQEIEALNAAIANCQSQLPATGAPVTRQRNDQMKEAFTRYVHERTLQNWKFYILSKIAEPLFDTFTSTVSTASLDELYRTSLSWLEQHGSLPALRPVVLESLRQLSRSTNILTDPSSFPKQAIEAVTEARTKGSSR